MWTLLRYSDKCRLRASELGVAATQIPIISLSFNRRDRTPNWPAGVRTNKAATALFFTAKLLTFAAIFLSFPPATNGLQNFSQL